MTMPPFCRPTEKGRMQHKVEGDVVCRTCKLPVGHHDCTHLSDKAVWERLPEVFDCLPRHEWFAKKWGIPFAISPPGEEYLRDYRRVKDKGEQQNFHFITGDGYELHVRQFDNTGYAFTVHYEPRAIGPHLGSIGSRHCMRIREDTRITRSAYAHPDNLEI